MSTITIDLPYLQEAYEALRAGKHLCLEDSLLYGALMARFEDYQAFFKALGLVLEQDKWGTIYFATKGSPRSAEKIVYFMAILVEWLDDKGISARASIDRERKLFEVADLPHLAIPKYVELMDYAVDVKGTAGVVSILTSMARYGFVELRGETEFRLRPPAHRLLDIVGMAGREAECLMADSVGQEVGSATTGAGDGFGVAGDDDEDVEG